MRQNTVAVLSGSSLAEKRGGHCVDASGSVNRGDYRGLRYYMVKGEVGGDEEEWTELRG